MVRGLCQAWRVDTFWATVATVIPVLALAVVLEFRAYGARWYDKPRWERALQATLLSGFFIAATVVENGAMAALVSDDPSESHPAWLSQLALGTVSYGIGLLILVPAIELLARLATPMLVAVRTAHPGLTFRVWLIYLKSRAERRRYARLLQKANAMEATARAEFADAEKEIRENQRGMEQARQRLVDLDAEDPERPVMQAYLDRASAWDAKARERIDGFKEVLGSRPDDMSTAFDAGFERANRLREEVARFTKQERAALEHLLQSIPIGLNPLLPPPPEPIGASNPVPGRSNRRPKHPLAATRPRSRLRTPASRRRG